MLPPGWLTQTETSPSLACTAVRKCNIWAELLLEITSALNFHSKSSQEQKPFRASSASKVKWVKANGIRGAVTQGLPYAKLRSTLVIKVEIKVAVQDKSCDTSSELHSRPLLFFQSQNSSGTAGHKLNSCCDVWRFRDSSTLLEFPFVRHTKMFDWITLCTKGTDI